MLENKGFIFEEVVLKDVFIMWINIIFDMFIIV